jgi:ferredoxin
MGDNVAREKEIQELKARAKEMKARLAALETRIEHAGKPTPALPRRHAFVDTDLCVGCGVCESVCPVEAISIEGEARIHIERCIGCGRCVRECPQGALSLEPFGVQNQPQQQFQSRLQYVG